MFKLPEILRVFILPLLILIVSCNWDDNEPDPQVPVITLVSLKDAAVITNDTCSFTWSASVTGCTFYYRLSNIIDTVWSEATALPKLDTLLSDGAYMLSLKAVLNGVSSKVVNLNFTVNSLTGPSVYLYPRYQTVKSFTDTVTFLLRGKNLPAGNMFDFKLSGFAISSVELAEPLDGISLKSDSTGFTYTQNPALSSFSGNLPLCTVKGVFTQDETAAAALTAAAGILSFKTTLVSATERQITTEIENRQSGIVSLPSAL